MGGQERRPEIEKAAEEMLTKASEGQSFSNQYNSMSQEDQRASFAAMKDLQAANTQKFGNVELIDSNNDGILDDAQATITRGALNPRRYTDGAQYKTDVYDTAQDMQNKLANEVKDGLIGKGMARDAGSALANRRQQLQAMEDELFGDKRKK
ncbi:MAG TPA: hypothetical protein V6D17_02120 [Candidatus Obscuribacterales bacterium]